MAGRWSSEIFSAEFKDLQASTMAVDCLGNWVLLAGRKNLAFFDLRRPGQTVVKVTRQKIWDVSCVQWNCHASHTHRFVTACNQRLDIFDFRDASASHLCSMKAHSRTVSDVDWSPFDVNIVASCSVDTYTYFWDVRDSKKPVQTFQTVSGAYQVKWNKVTNNLFATTHDGDVRIWDPRKGNAPVQYISAHPSRIHGLDWSHKDQYKLVTASQDCTIRFWDYNTPRRSEAMINSGNPVWRARYTPFGDVVMSVVVPQLRRGENSLSLWHQSNSHTPVHTFVGHKDVVLEFQWRKQFEGVHDHQLVSWSKDQTLRIWKVDTAMQRLCGHDIMDDIPEDILNDDPMSVSQTVPTTSPTTRNSRPSSLSSSSSIFTCTSDNERTSSSAFVLPSPTVVMPLELELDNLTSPGRISGVRLEQTDIGKRTCVLKLQRSSNFMDVELIFPSSYPNKKCPTLTIKNTNLDQETQSGIAQTFQDVSTKLVNQNMNCLETTLKKIMPLMEKSRPYSSPTDGQAQEDRKAMLESKYHVEKVKSPTSPISPNSAAPMYPIGSFQDSSVPFPRTSGARFCSNDRLVMFSVPPSLKKVLEDVEQTPKALSDLVTCTQSQWRPQPSFSPFNLLYGSPQPSSYASISDFFTEKHGKTKHRPGSHGHHHHHHHKAHRKSTGDREYSDGRGDREKDAEKQTKKLQKVGAITIYDIAGINPVSKFLAENYKLDSQNIQGTCEHNAAVAMKLGRKDLVQLWKLISQMSHPLLQPSPNIEMGPPWAFNPFGRSMVEKFLNHYSQVRDIQTMAMICCMFWDKDPPLREIPSSLSMQESRISFEYAADNYNPYHTVSSMTNLLKGWTSSHAKVGKDSAVMKNKRSLSWSNSYEDIRIDPREREIEKERILHNNIHHNNSKMLDPERKAQHEQIKKAYANVLYKWNLLNKRTEILKHTDITGSPIRQIEFIVSPTEFIVSCHKCNEAVQGNKCSKCTYPALLCSICHIGVRGAANVCLACGHGGHTHHMMSWFKTETMCPTGCGCNCLLENTIPDVENKNTS